MNPEMNKDKRIPMEILFVNYPICTLPLIESYLSYKNILPDLSYVYTEYSLRYLKYEEDLHIYNRELNVSLTIRENESMNIGTKAPGGVNVCPAAAGSIHIDYNPEDIYLKELYKIYGVYMEPVIHVNADDFRQYIYRQIDRDEPVLFQYNLYFIPERMCYRTLYFDHMIAINGYNNTEHMYYCTDGNESPHFMISDDDLTECFTYVSQRFGHVKSFQIKVDAGPGMIPESKYLKNRLKEIMDYNTKEDHGTGLKAFHHFAKDFAGFLGRNKQQEPFDIIDVFKVYKERKTACRSLHNFAGTESVHTDHLKDLLVSLEAEGNLWFEFSVIMKKSLFEGRWNFDRQAIFLLQRIHQAMIRTMDRIDRLYHSIM